MLEDALTGDAYVQTHLDENFAEIAFVKRQFPWAKTYLDVYARYGLLGPRSVRFWRCSRSRCAPDEASILPIGELGGSACGELGAVPARCNPR